MKTTVFLIAFLFLTGLLNAQDGEKRKSAFNTENGLALSGYDPVAYFKSGKAIKGNPAFAVRAAGITYHCSSAENKELFLKNYKTYEPEFGGWCAYAMGNTGEKVEIDLETFKIINGKLYLFYNAYFNNTLKLWNKNEATLLKQANTNWTKYY